MVTYCYRLKKLWLRFPSSFCHIWVKEGSNQTRRWQGRSRRSNSHHIRPHQTPLHTQLSNNSPLIQYPQPAVLLILTSQLLIQASRHLTLGNLHLILYQVSLLHIPVSPRRIQPSLVRTQPSLLLVPVSQLLTQHSHQLGHKQQSIKISAKLFCMSFKWYTYVTC